MFTTWLYFIPSLYQQSLGVTISIVYMFLYLILLSYARFIYLDVLGETLLRIFWIDVSLYYVYLFVYLLYLNTSKNLLYIYCTYAYLMLIVYYLVFLTLVRISCIFIHSYMNLYIPPCTTLYTFFLLTVPRVHYIYIYSCTYAYLMYFVFLYFIYV